MNCNSSLIGLTLLGLTTIGSTPMIGTSNASSGETVILSVNAPDGPMPPFVAAVRKAGERKVSNIVVHVENTQIVNDAELVDLVIMSTIDVLNEAGSYASSNIEIVQCPRKCGAPVPQEPTDNGTYVKITVNAPDGPMPKALRAVQRARKKGISKVVVNLENTALLVDPELLELVVLETTNMLASNGFTGQRGIIDQCPKKC